jgi:hypothetical protein
MAKKTTAKQIYQIKVTLQGSAKPPIWRRLLLADNTPLDELHDVLQVAMGWENAHLHMFSYGQEFYGPLDEYDRGNTLDEAKYRLNQLMRKEKDSLVYIYDFGDDWRHKIVLEKILPPDAQQNLPFCVTGKGACPPEDCGGIYGYYDLLRVLADSNDEEYEDMLEWAGELHPEVFSAAEANKIFSEHWNSKK